MRTKENFYTLIAELEVDISELSRLKNLNQRGKERVLENPLDELNLGALAFTLHHIYSLLENYFLRVSKFFENGLPSEAWHKTLVERMTLNIPGLRPPLLLDTQLKNDALELQKFSIKILSLYAEELEISKLLKVQSQAEFVLQKFPKAHEEFVVKIRKIADYP